MKYWGVRSIKILEIKGVNGMVHKTPALGMSSQSGMNTGHMHGMAGAKHLGHVPRGYALQ